MQRLTAGRGLRGLLQNISSRQVAFQSTNAVAQQQFGWEDWANYLASDQVKKEYLDFRTDFTHMKKSILESAKEPVPISTADYVKVLGKDTVTAIQSKLGASEVAVPDMDAWQKRASEMLSKHKGVAAEVDAFNEIEYQDAMRWADMLNHIEANIDTISVDEVLGCFPETAQQIDDDIEEYWWRPEDKVEPGHHDHH